MNDVYILKEGETILGISLGKQEKVPRVHDGCPVKRIPNMTDMLLGHNVRWSAEILRQRNPEELPITNGGSNGHKGISPQEYSG